VIVIVIAVIGFVNFQLGNK